MKANFISFDFSKSLTRIDEILNASDLNYEEINSIPSRDKLTFTNGFYVNCTALFIDVRDSSTLPDKYKRPVLARIYRTYISEAVALMNSDPNCSEVNIQGDSVWGIFDTTQKINIDAVFSLAAQLSSIVDVINCKLKKRKIEPITVGIGIDYGRALMIKAGFSGSGINDVVYMGDVVNSASNLCGHGNSSYLDAEVMVSTVVYNNLNEKNKSLLQFNYSKQCYCGNVINIPINDYVTKNCT
jgi:class 3 adenylate cyclase